MHLVKLYFLVFIYTNCTLKYLTVFFSAYQFLLILFFFKRPNWFKLFFHMEFMSPHIKAFLYILLQEDTFHCSLWYNKALCDKDGSENVCGDGK